MSGFREKWIFMGNGTKKLRDNYHLIQEGTNIPEGLICLGQSRKGTEEPLEGKF